MMLVFCVTVGFSGTRLGQCWVMMEERWPELYGGISRQPYVDMAGVTLGKPGRCVCVCFKGGLVVVMGKLTWFLYSYQVKNSWEPWPSILSN